MTYPNQRYAATSNGQPPRRAQGRTPEEERRIVRQSVLKSAIEWAQGAEPRPKSEDVLKLAECFERWVYR